MKTIQTLSPFKRFCMTIGELPSSYLESMTYAELVMWFCNFLESKVIPAINNNAEAVKEIQHFIETLDIQDEVNNKLDEMAEDGTLQEIMSEYLNTRAIFAFNNIEELKQATNLIEGSFVETYGYYNAGDGGSTKYKIRNVVNTDIPNNMNIIALHDENLVAEICPTNIINPEMVGAVGDSTNDDTLSLQKCIDIANNYKIKVLLSSKEYLITSPLTIYSNVEIDGNNATIKTNENIKMIISAGCSYINIHDLKLIGNNGDENYGIFISSYFSNYKNITIGKVKTGIHIDASQVAGTLVENRLENIKVYQYDYAGLYLGDNNNAKITDGYLINTIVSGNQNASYGIFIGSSAGWCINGAHIYGHNNNAIQLNNSNATNVSNIYIEYFKTYGLVMASTQTGNNVSNIYIRHNATGTTGDAIHVENSTYLPANTHSGNMTNINIFRAGITTGKSINIAGGYANAWNITNVIIDSTANKTIANDCSGINYNYQGLHYENEAKLSLNNSQTLFNYISTYNYKGFNQNTTSIDIDLPTLGNLVPSAIKITAVGGRFTSQSGVFYTGEIYFVKDNNGLLHAWIKNNDTNTIFATNPTISVDDSNNKLTLSFTVNANLYGRIYYNILT